MMRAYETLREKTMLPVMNIVLRAARQANEYIVLTVDKHEHSVADNDASQRLVTHLESIIFGNVMDAIKKGYPEHYIAEPGEIAPNDKDDCWEIVGFDKPAHVVRKLPGTTYAIIHRSKDLISNAIVVNPFTGEEFTATRGRGATLNARRMRTNSCKALTEAYIATDVLNLIGQHPQNPYFTELTSALAKDCAELRINSNNTLNLAMVASGQVDAAILCEAEPDKLKAALLMCQESGVLTGKLDGGMLGKNQSTLIAANSKLFKILVQRYGTYTPKLAK